ncbi:MAG: hypothetical protein KIS76_03905 [Pyrinomonadaceae bacterium]|nr:hypothetical protein [Pyrinomonadaceae bacterium]
MKNEWILKKLTMRQALLLALFVGLVVSLAATVRPQTNSAESSPDSVTRADDEALRKACAEAVEELKVSRIALEKQGILIEKQRELLGIEGEIAAKLRTIENLSEREKLELRSALAAKDRAIAGLEDQVKMLKKKRFTVWKGLKYALVGAAAGIVAGSLMK